MAGTSPYRWRLVALFLLGSALSYGDRSAIASVFPLFRSELGATDVELGALGSAFLWAYMLAAPVGGILADRFSRRRILIACLAAWSAVTFATGFAANAGQLIATRVLLGLAEASFLPAALALLSEYHGTDTRATAFGITAAGQPLGVIAGNAGLGWAAEHFGWRRGFFGLGALGIVLAAITALVLRPDRAGGAAGAAIRPAPAHRLVLLQQPALLAVLAASTIVSIGTWIFLYWLPLYFGETYGMTLAGAGFAGTFMLQLASIVAGIGGGIVSDRFAGSAPARRIFLQIGSYVAAAPFLAIFLLPRPALAALNACIFLFSFLVWFGAANAVPFACDLLPDGTRAFAVSLFSSFGCLGGGIGVLLAGFLKASLGLGGVFAGISLLLLVAAGLLGAGLRAVPPGRRRDEMIR